VTNGVDGWELVLYMWDEDTGVARFKYERGPEEKPEVKWVQRAQPATTTHVGWYTRPS
jgi:hypothetical protein